MWKQILSPPGLSKYEISEYGEIRDIETKTPKPIYKDAHGYPVVYMNYVRVRKGKYKYTEYKVHRLVAEQYIGHIPDGYEVHHLDENKSNPYYKNLVICSPKEHRRYHATTREPVPNTVEYKGLPLMSDETVHKICQMLEDGCSFPFIRETLKIYNVTDDAIGKIAQGKNWRRISSQYNIPKVTRECMNSYSDYAVVIAILRNKGMLIKDIARCIGFELKTKREYDRLEKCTSRYLRWFHECRWGLFTYAREDKILKQFGIKL